MHPQNYEIMVKLALFCVIILAVSMFFLCIGIIFKKNGRFPNSHVSASKAMRDRGVTCAQSQDRMARVENPRAVKE